MLPQGRLVTGRGFRRRNGTQLLDEVWGYDQFPITRTVDNHIAELRQKIEDHPADPQHIITVHRVGYRFVP
jgi:DNA-binding response OmpR family regulator